MRRHRPLLTSLLLLGVILIAIPLAVFLSLHQQQTQQRAAGSSTDITVDFGSRQNTAHPINSHFAGMNGFNKILGNSQVYPYLAPSHFDLMRVSVDMVGTFPSSTQQNWSSFDTMMNGIASQNLHPILTIGYTPVWLQPNPNPCGTSGNSHVVPTNAQAWGQLAAAVVAHMDKAFPAIHPEYEIWNEPDGTNFLCVVSSDPNPDQTRLNEYKQIYGAAGPLMKQQAQKDGVTIHIGGPALAVPKARASLWFPALVSDPTIYPYLDFITYHDYQNGGAPGDNWTTFLAGTQNATTGQAAIFEQISKYVRSGKQPNPSQTPIYEDEYNTNTGLPNSARNDPTFAPLWNSLIIADLLNTVNDTSSSYGAAQQAVAGFAYFVATQPPPGNEFCLFGTWDSAMDCAAGNQPYPQYYAYQLFSDPKYLDITNRGYMANSASTAKSGLVVTGFSTGTKDNIVVVNTGATAYTNLTVGFQNPGNITATTATVLTLNQANPHIASSQTSVQLAGTGYTGTINIPAYTTVAVSLTAGGGGGGTTPTVTATPTPSPRPTITVTPTPSSSPTPTLPANTTALYITLCPHGLGNCGDNVTPGRGGNANPLHTSRNITVTLLDASNAVVATIPGNVAYQSTAATFQERLALGNTIPSGAYLVKLTMDGFLPKQVTGIITITQGQTTALPVTALVSGNVNNDTQLDLTDYNILVSCFGAKFGTSQCLSPEADLNDDGVVDGGDYNIFLRELSVQRGG